KPGRGTIVLTPKDATRIQDKVLHTIGRMDPELKHIMELRAIVEPPIAAITATQASKRDITQLRELVEAMEQETDKHRYALLARASHQAIAQYTHNPLLAFINGQIAASIAPSRADRSQTGARRDASSAAHRRIFQAIAQGDSAQAE